ncbi:hypothetical protein CYMTET_5426 [Cymbomonas tetramitiformis]|uniref:Aminotransferase class V domain-containing protein n=1 Tax=Cymbomonas tetramitiformis TaxID=36881 RepID=A0AAE0LJD9_9CHLO|nr:hypothetical protein CYMTET_5426 [Cymbomonas tetramitiformis]
MEDLLFCENCSSAANAVISSSRIEEGDVCITFSTAYGMVRNKLLMECSARKAEVRQLQVEFPGGGSKPTGPGGESLPAALGQLLRSVASEGRRVALVCMDHISSAPGCVMPVMDLCRAARQELAADVPIALDAAHVLGQVDVNLRALEEAGCTHWFSDGHKWFFSPKGSALLWCSEPFQAELLPAVKGAVASNSRLYGFTKTSVIGAFTEVQQRFLYTGTRDYTPWCAMAEALAFRQWIGEATILERNWNLALWGSKLLADAWGTETLLDEGSTAMMAHARLPVDTEDEAVMIGEVLSMHGVHCLLFPLARPASQGGEVRYWARPCAQLFVAEADFHKLATITLEALPDVKSLCSTKPIASSI